MNYRSATRGRSRAEFIAKLGIVVEEADESVGWLELISEVELASGAELPADSL
jgi:four helix bundle protein